MLRMTIILFFLVIYKTNSYFHYNYGNEYNWERMLGNQEMAPPKSAFTHTIHLKGNSDEGYYYATIYVGTPP